MSERFYVSAGKYEASFPGDENVKYSDVFETLDKALDALAEVRGYPWSRIEYNGWVIEAYRP